MRVDSDELRSFLAVARTGSLTAASALLHVSVSALSRRISRLEAQVRTPLFVRAGHRLVPTTRGRELAARITPAVESLLDAFEDARLRTDGAGELTLLGVLPASRQLLPTAAARLAREHPALRITVGDMPPAELLLAVVSGAAALGLGFQAEARPPLEFEPLIRDPLVLVVPQGHRLSARRSVAWRELEGERVFGLADGEEQGGIEPSIQREGLARYLDRRLRHASSALGLVEARLGLAVLPRSALPAKARGIAVPLLREPSLDQVIGIWMRSDSAQDGLLAQLRSHLRSAANPELPR